LVCAVLDVPLRARTTVYVRAFLSDLGQQAKVEPSKANQVQEALWCCIRNIYLGVGPPWPFHVYAMEAAGGV
jgi:hypothetical protein